MKNKEQHTFPFIEHLLDGAKVEWKKLGDVCEIKTGQTVSKNIIAENEGEFPVINSGREPLGFINTWNTDNDPIGVTSRGAGVGSITWQEGKYFRGNLNYSVSINNFSILNTKFLYYLLLQMQVDIQALCTYQGIPALNAVNFKKLLIPIPPLSVQERIVEILDKFTTLEAELEAELDCRKRQYEYYRNQLLSFDVLNRGGQELNNVSIVALGDLGEFVRGSGLPKKDFTSTGVGCIHYGQIYTYYGTSTDKTLSFVSPETASRLKHVDYGDVIVTNTSENIEDVCKAVAYMGKESIVIGGHACIFKPSNKIDAKYFVYYTQTERFACDKRKYAKGTKVIDVSINDLSKITIPIPPLAEQERIVSILDKFDALTTSISEGLPKEIELRRKQYEYYRERLLSFKH